jgi:hypothetical protein
VDFYLFTVCNHLKGDFYLIMDPSVQDSEVQQILLDADANGDGLISAQEFKDYLAKVFPGEGKKKRGDAKGRSSSRRKRSQLYDIRMSTANLVRPKQIEKPRYGWLSTKLSGKQKKPVQPISPGADSMRPGTRFGKR